jgi:myo-inositol-1(or 4)-monophosphatase
VTDLLDTARAAALAAADLLRTAHADQLRSKSHRNDLVTEWDTRAEDLIRRVLAERTPGIPVLGEEGGLGEREDLGPGREDLAGRGDSAGGLRWLVDPIDGTVNFAHGFPYWSISIAIEDGTGVLAGVVEVPMLGWRFEAVRGAGAFDEHGQRLAVSSVSRLERALLVTGFPYDRATHPVNNFAEWEHMQRRAGACRRLGTASIDLCLVARGWMDGYWERRLHAWDVAAGGLIAREAGGTVTDTRGRPFDPHTGEVVASNGAIHEELIAELGSVRRPAS